MNINYKTKTIYVDPLYWDFVETTINPHLGFKMIETELYNLKNGGKL